MSQPPVFFLRGLNSIGDDSLRFGPVPVGYYHTRFTKPFRNLKVTPVFGMGRGTAEEMGERALKSILAMPEFQMARKIHIVGHSLGGLVGRYLAHQPEVREKLLSVVTIGTPHAGTPAAENDESYSKISDLVMKLVNADPKKAAYYVSARRDRAKEFAEKYPNLPEVHYSSVVGSRAFRELPLGFQILERRNNRDGLPTDGLIPVESQKWGDILGEVSLDHLEQIGLCGHATPWERLRFLREFDRQRRLLSTFWRSF